MTRLLSLIDGLLGRTKGAALALALPLSLITATAARAEVDCEGEASFSVTFRSHWVEGVTVPALPSDLAFSPMVVATHQSAGDIYEVGGLASPGIRRLTETGKQTELSSELKALLDARVVRAVRTGKRLEGMGQSSVTLRATPEHPMLTMIATVAPSPDWIVGINGVSLCEGGQWLKSLVLPLMAQDAGTDSGTSFTASRQATSPQQPIQYLDTQLRLTNAMGNEAVFGTLSIRRN